ncbi:aminopeptidase Ey isoform X2 [Esox lucius]|uniref:aminopeptidase Ey isoform X2 n=1 Tax=Esox lucius TaxID=8010 RepID=UPI00147755B6|nr:aminopeptidase Ey isoform X2 [Esox lucius]
MAKGFYVSKSLGLVGLVTGAAALVTIVALSVVYDREKTRNTKSPADDGVTATMAVSISTTQSVPKDPWDHYRLPDALSPVSYNITLWPRLQVNQDGLYIFTGQSAVVFECKKPTDLILIHSNKLNLTLINGRHARLTGLGGATPPTIKDSWLQVETEFLVIQLNGKLSAGKIYMLFTEFKGELADDLEGFYRSEYTEDGVLKVVATSQMQPTYARKAFPCFDEPAMKAVFHITLFHDRGTVALSNGRDLETINTTKDGFEVTMTRFEPTERMSTYLLAFIVSDFDHVTGSVENSNILVRIWARRKAVSEGQGDYALNVTGPMLRFYEKYYNTSYPLSKSDQIALPDFNAGAMENWGLITYRETALLFDSEISSVGNKERVTTVVAHELAHMWFGNLVTLRWWNDLWLNEGFASYVEYLGADYAEPTWNIKEQIILYDVHKVFAVDALASSHPLSRKEEEVNRPAEISEMFNTISYSKGAAVLRMLSEFLTEPVFARGLSSYLNKFAFNNTVYTDLWDHLQKAVISTPEIRLPDTVHNIMNRWVLQMGFPVVTIDTTNGKITQKHFLLDPDSVVERPSPYNYTWFVPIKWMKGGVEQEQHWLLQRAEHHLPMRTSGSEWLLVNLKMSGYYRVNYNLENWERLLNQLNTDHLVIPVINRAQILDDAFNLARAKIVNTTLALRTTRIHPNLKSTVYCNAIAAGGVEEWDFAWMMLKNATVATEAAKLRGALACTKAPWLLNRYLEYSLDPAQIRKQDATATISNVASNVVGMPLAWAFVRARWSYIFSEYGGGSFSFSNLINAVTRRFSTEFELKQLKQFKEDNAHVGSGSGTLALEQAIEKTSANIRWVAENQQHIINWFTSESR